MVRSLHVRSYEERARGTRPRVTCGPQAYSLRRTTPPQHACATRALARTPRPATHRLPKRRHPLVVRVVAELKVGHEPVVGLAVDLRLRSSSSCLQQQQQCVCSSSNVLQQQQAKEQHGSSKWRRVMRRSLGTPKRTAPQYARVHSHTRAQV